MTSKKYNTDEKLEIKTPNKELIYGVNNQRLRLGINVEGNSGLSKTITFTRLATTGTGLQTFGGFGFTPTDYIIKAWRYGDVTETGFSLLCMSEGQYSAPYRQRIRPNGAYHIELDQITTILSISYGNIPLGKSTIAIHSAFTGNGITLNFISSLEDIMIQITAIK